LHELHAAYLSFLRARADKVFYRAPYSGNAGDSLIQFATEQLLQDAGIRTTVNPSEADVILIPGGNPTMWPSIGSERWRELWKRYPRAEFVVGPAGFRNGHSDWAEQVNTAGHRVTGLFARDPDSFDNLNHAGLNNGIVLALSHDPALYLRDSEWVLAHRKASSEEYHLAAFRDDHEATTKYPALSKIISLMPQRFAYPLGKRRARTSRNRKLKLVEKLSEKKSPVVENDVSRQRFEVFVEVVRAARTVHTDRLHVMLLAVMLGKKVFAYPTSHSKLEGVYRHSLKDWADVSIVSA